MNIFFSSDLHLFHKRVLEFESETRPFSCIEEMHEVIVDRWNSKVPKDSECYLLGDISFGKITETVQLLNRLHGAKCLITGNHDAKFAGKQEFLDVFEGRVFDLLETKINKTFYVMCHYPMMSWNRSHYNSLQLFGHLHTRWKGNKQQLNVGMDCHNLSPISIEEIPELLSALPDRFDFFAENADGN